MNQYRVDFEFWSADGWSKHTGTFRAATPKIAKANVVGQLAKIGIATRGLAVYEGETIVLGSVLPLDCERAAS